MGDVGRGRDTAAACPVCGALSATRPGRLDCDDSSPPTFPATIAAALHLIPALTPRERTTFDLLGLGYDNRSIARSLDISERTAKRHVTAILSKLELESRLQAGLAALIVSSLAFLGGAGQKAAWIGVPRSGDTRQLT